MKRKRRRGGEPDAARLLALARAELLNELLPQLDGISRYRARLIANALQIARRELEAGGDEVEAVLLRKLTEVAAPTLAPSYLPPDTSLRDALRHGALDGNRQFYDLLVRLSAVRGRLID